MKLGLVFAALSMVACAKTVTPAKAPTKPAPATAEDCNAVWSKLVAIAVRDHMDPDGNYNKQEHAAAMELMDQHFQDAGVKGRFFISCISTANVDQTRCMSEADDVQGVAMCAKLFESKKNP